MPCPEAMHKDDETFRRIDCAVQKATQYLTLIGKKRYRLCAYPGEVLFGKIFQMDIAVITLIGKAQIRDRRNNKEKKEEENQYAGYAGY